MSPTQFLAGTTLDAAAFADPLHTVAAKDEFQLIRNLMAHCGDPPGLGLEVGRHYRFTSLAAVGFALASSPSLRAAFDIAQRYAALRPSLAGLVLEHGGADLCVAVHPHGVPDELCRFVVERSVAALLAIASDLLGRPLRPAALDLAFPLPIHARVYKERLGVAPVFERPVTRLVLRRIDAEAPLPLGNALALRSAEEQCRRWMQTLPIPALLSVRVREQLVRRPDSLPSAGTVAAALDLSPRMLRRGLQDEGTRYLVLCDEVRTDFAIRLLRMPWLSIEAIGEQLGYAEPASFIRAFKRWTGQTPQAFRGPANALLRRQS